VINLNEIFTVNQLNEKIKKYLETNYELKGIKLKGEVSNFIKHSTGHLYFSLKEGEKSVIGAAMFSYKNKYPNLDIKNGDKIIVKGDINLYVPRGDYRIIISEIERDGLGDLYIEYLERKSKLRKMGWFDKTKKEIPKIPLKIGVITSPTGAVIKDILNTVNRRYRLSEIILYPSAVQGASAAPEISRQINRANEDNLCDVLIVGRGGGSMEDLWAFNELSVISAIYHSKIPIISAIGHETDDTLSDLVSDLRAATPTAAAELATPKMEDLIDNANNKIINVRKILKNMIIEKQVMLVHVAQKLELLSPLKKIENNIAKINANINLLRNVFQNILNKKIQNFRLLRFKVKNFSPITKIKNNFKNLDKTKADLEKNYQRWLYFKKNMIEKNLLILNNLNPLNVLKRGFVVIEDESENIISSSKNIKLNSDVKIRFKDGNATAKIIRKENI